MNILHPSVYKKCVPTMLSALGEGWSFSLLAIVPSAGLVFKHVSGWEMRFYWIEAHGAFRRSHDSRVPQELRGPADEAAAAGTALVKVRGWDHPEYSPVPDYAELEERALAQLNDTERSLWFDSLRGKKEGA